MRKRIHKALGHGTILWQHNPGTPCNKRFIKQLLAISMGTYYSSLYSSFQQNISESTWKLLQTSRDQEVFNMKLTVQKIAVGASLNATRARPKSQIFSLQSAFASTFFGFKSRWNTFAAHMTMRCKNDLCADVYTHGEHTSKNSTI